jgi:hypothetical protein
MSALIETMAPLTQIPIPEPVRVPYVGTSDTSQPLPTSLAKSLTRSTDGLQEFTVAPQLALDAIVDGLDQMYVIENRPAVGAFIDKYGLRGLLLQAVNPLNEAFGHAAIKVLSLITDDEGFQTLFCLVPVTDDLEVAKRSLDSFDEWWLLNCGREAGRLNFDFELT